MPTPNFVDRRPARHLCRPLYPSISGPAAPILFPIVLAFAIPFLCTSCAWFSDRQVTEDIGHDVYLSTGSGKFEGDLDIRWVKPDRFLFIPNPAHPFRFTTSGNLVITPEKMVTDGGSIPREFWAVKDYSPWRYGPAFVIHDWLFEAHHCKTAGYEKLSFNQSATILAESIKTLMESHVAPRDELALWTIFEAVSTPKARAIWDKPNGCNPPGEARNREGDGSEGKLLFTMRGESVLSQR